MILSGCGGNAAKHGHDGGHESHDGHEHSFAAHADANHDHSQDVAEPEPSETTDGEIIFTKVQVAMIDFAVMKIEPSVFNEIITASGQILAAQGDESAIAATVGGIVSFGSKTISEGTAVGRGETLFYISSKTMAEGDYYTRIAAAYEQAKAAYERNVKLVADRLISLNGFEQSKLAYDRAKAAYDALASSTSTQGVGVAAPISGYVKSIDVVEGQFVETGQVLGTVSQNRRLTLRVEVSQKYYAALRTVTSANFRTPYNNRLYSLAEMNGRLISVGKAADANSAFIPVTFEFDNKGDIVQGSFVEVFLVSSPQSDVIAVPATALLEEQGVYSVFVRLDDEGYRKQEVRIGATDGENVRILSGLQAGQTIVTRGVQQLKSTSSSSAIPHGHTH